jgi:hypothetical protein
MGPVGSTASVRCGVRRCSRTSRLAKDADVHPRGFAIDADSSGGTTNLVQPSGYPRIVGCLGHDSVLPFCIEKRGLARADAGGRLDFLSRVIRPAISGGCVDEARRRMRLSYFGVAEGARRCPPRGIRGGQPAEEPRPGMSIWPLVIHLSTIVPAQNCRAVLISLTSMTDAYLSLFMVAAWSFLLRAGAVLPSRWF